MSRKTTPTTRLRAPQSSEPTRKAPPTPKASRRAESGPAPTNGHHPDPAWAVIMAATAHEPIVHRQLKRIEKAAGGTPPQLWLAGAIEFLFWFDRIERQKALAVVMCEGAGQECDIDQ